MRGDEAEAAGFNIHADCDRALVARDTRKACFLDAALNILDRGKEG
jgi:hypothetical protein